MILRPTFPRLTFPPSPPHFGQIQYAFRPKSQVIPLGARTWTGLGQLSFFQILYLHQEAPSIPYPQPLTRHPQPLTLSPTR